MSVVRPKPPEDPIRYDPSAVFATGGVSREELAALSPRLDQSRQETLADIVRYRDGQTRPGEVLDPVFIDLPDRLLADYNTRRPESELFAILSTARRIREAVDRVVVLGIGGSYMGTRALFEACCHPFHNELPRGERGPATALVRGLQHRQRRGPGAARPARSAGHRRQHGRSSRPLGPAGRQQEWRHARDGRRHPALPGGGCSRRSAATGAGWPNGSCRSRAGAADSRRLAGAIGCPDVFDIPDGVGGRFSVFTAVGLLPAAIVGIDVVRLLEGAAAMNRRFREAPVAENPVLQYVGVCHLAEAEMGATIRILSTWSSRLEAVGLWYDQLLSESLGKAEKGATPLTTVTTRDLHSRGQQHQEGRRDKLITNLLVGEPRRDRVTLPSIGGFAANQDSLEDLVGRAWPDMLSAAAAGTNEAYAADRRPTADITLPRIDEHTVGQLLQMLMLATVAEGRLVGTNPYGQPGVEAYKQCMMRRLRP